MKTKHKLICFCICMMLFVPLWSLSVRAEEEQAIVPDEASGVLQNGGLLNPGPERGLLLSSADDSVERLTKLIYSYAVQWNGSDAEMTVDVRSHNFLADDVVPARNMAMNSYPELFYFKNCGYYCYGTTEKRVSKIILMFDNQKYNGADIQIFKAAADNILAGVDSAWSEEQKALYLHDYLVTHCAYDLKYSKYNAFNVLVEGSGVCQGYALAYRYLLTQSGMKCGLITSDELNHAWNVVTVDGYQYYTDCTWDDPTTRTSDGTASVLFPDYCSHEHFLRNTVSFHKKHDREDWVDEAGDYVYGQIVTGSKYENAYWMNCKSPIPHLGDLWASYSDRTISVHDYVSGIDRELCTIESGADHLSKYNDQWILTADEASFLFSNWQSIQRVYPDGKLGRFYICSQEEKEQGSIYGIRVEDGKLTYNIADSWAYADIKATKSIDLSKLYTATWLGVDGAILQADHDLAAGISLPYDGELPEKTADENYRYEFDAWYPIPVPDSDDVTYLATYLEAPADSASQLKSGISESISLQNGIFTQIVSAEQPGGTVYWCGYNEKGQMRLLYSIMVPLSRPRCEKTA